MIAHNGSICGNKIVEEGEMCDCGEAGECDMVDPCCTAPNTTTGTPGCTIRTGKQCRYVQFSSVLLSAYSIIHSFIRSLIN